MRELSRRAWMAAASTMGVRAAQETVRLPQKLRLGVIGLEGHVDEILGPLDRLPDIELVAIQDRDASLLRQVSGSKHAGRARSYARWQDLLEKEKLDIAGICGPNAERAELICECAKRKWNIVAEKPLAITTPDLDRVKKAVADSGVHLTMLIEMRFSAPYRALKKIVESGEIGEVVQMGAQKSYKLGERPDWMRHRATFGGTIPYIGIHMVDLMRWTSGRELVEVVSYQSRVGHPEMLDMEVATASVFRLDNGGVAALRMDYFRPETAPTWGDDRLRLAGTRGVAEFQAATGVTLISDRQAPRQIADLPASGSLFLDFLNSAYAGRPAELSLKDIYRVNDIVLAARDSADEHRIVRL